MMGFLVEMVMTDYYKTLNKDFKIECPEWFKQINEEFNQTKVNDSGVLIANFEYKIDSISEIDE